ncbi:uncharacterized protein LOC132601519 [Lycium barbarum]|uniref:uncharacterized protein LOC132601519 n=1 Tax=Lycium barbarum TaxID=112863 RepID=UPI00293EAF15|nr:uncharacterized protein LOC132601519 [Lycium barbarum]
MKEELFEEVPSPSNRCVLQCAQAEYKTYLNFKKEYWRQKAGVDWFAEGDRNTRFFHNLVKGRRKKYMINKIQGSDGTWLEDETQMAAEAVNFYQTQFSQEEENSQSTLLDNVPNLIDQQTNIELCKMPSLEEIKQAVFNLNGTSASGLDGFSGKFYQSCWNIIGADVYKLVLEFFKGQTLPKSITHTNLVLLPKTDIVQTYSDLRPISLSNFINKIISRVVHYRLENVLPSFISSNQAGFVKGKSIIENVLLSQEIKTDISKRGKPANVVIKLDMEKAYDRTTGFFHSTRGAKQGDPLSFALFIISAEWSHNINHLSYADDTIIFTSAEKESLQKAMFVLKQYEEVSGQLINKEKSAFHMFHKVATNLIQQVEQVTGFSRDSFPLKYLGFVPTKYTINELHKIFARFFWSNKEKGRSKHWVSWGKICLPKEEGGFAFRSRYDVSKALFAKLWWKFRTENTMWETFMWNKYCKKHRSTEVQWRGGSQIWKRMLEARELVDQHIWWEPRSGECNVWQDNWTKLGCLKHIMPLQDDIAELNVFMTDARWDFQKLQAVFPLDIVNHISSDLGSGERCDEKDNPWWMLTADSKFSVKSAWNTLRQHSQYSVYFKRLWSKGVPVDDVFKRMHISIVSKCRCCGEFAMSLVILQCSSWCHRSFSASSSSSSEMMEYAGFSYNHNYLSGCSSLHLLADLEKKEYNHAWW